MLPTAPKIRPSILRLCLCLLILASCGEDKLSPLSANDTILAFGDSLTAGVGVQASESYPSVLAKLTGRTVINAGISGETSAEGLARFNSTLAKYKPAVVILLEGGNDILQNKASAETRNNLDQMIVLTKDSGAELVLVGVPRKNLFSEVSPIYIELAEKHQVLLVDDLISGLLRNPKYKSDAVHFNAAGYRIMAQTIAGLLEDNGAL